MVEARRRLAGLGASPGWAAGPAFVYGPREKGTSARRVSNSCGSAAPTIPPAGQSPDSEGPSSRPRVEDELRRWQSAVETEAERTRRLKERALQVAGPEEAAVFQAHLLILKDPELERLVVARVKDGQVLEAAVSEAVASFAGLLEALPDPYLAQRAADVRDVGRRLGETLGGGAPSGPAPSAPTQPAFGLGNIPLGSIIVAHDLAPSETVQLDPEAVAGIVTASGGPTSHTAIFARAMGLPALVAVGPGLADVTTGTPLLLDADAGQLTINPQPEEIQALKQRAGTSAALPEGPAPDESGQTRTRDGWRVKVFANIGHPKEASSARERGAEGIGLFRSEFLYLKGNVAPDEEEQYRAYSQVLETFAGLPVVVRTLDLGGDKPVPYLPFTGESNPFLGWRGLRVCLDSDELFQTQLRALLRASVHGRLRVMFPMVTDLGEVRRALKELKGAEAALAAEGRAFDPQLSVGIMVETPAAALLAPSLAAETAFFSLGTNDLTQYTLAVDRTNERVARLHRPEHPAVLRLIAMTVEAARAAGRWVGVCGEMASDLDLVPILVGLGLEELSVSAPFVPTVRDRLRNLDSTACEDLARQALACVTADEVRKLARAFG